MTNDAPPKPVKPPVNWRLLGLQLAVVATVLLIFGWMLHNMFSNLAKRGIMVGFDYLERTARFPIAESVLDYTPADSFAWAITVGVANTLFISLIVIVLSTVLGVLLGLARRSTHPLAYGLASAFTDAIRNTPLVVQLLFWYGFITYGLPASAEAFNPAPGVFFTDRGLYFPSLRIDGAAWIFWLTIIMGGAFFVYAQRRAARETRKTGLKSGRRNLLIVPATIVAALIVWAVFGLTLDVSTPVLGRFNFGGGLLLSPEFVAIILGLVLYTTAFIGEIVRSGIGAVAKGQWEAGRAIGLSERQNLRFVIAPQALRIIVPPLTSQYINILKNSTLGLVVGYPELNFVIATTINQTGQAIEGVFILMVVFLSISIAASLLMNWYNSRIALTTR